MSLRRSIWPWATCVALAHAGLLWGLGRWDRSEPVMDPPAIAADLENPADGGAPPDEMPSPLPTAKPRAVESDVPPDHPELDPPVAVDPVPVLASAATVDAASEAAPVPGIQIGQESSTTPIGGEPASGTSVGAGSGDGEGSGSDGETGYLENPAPRYPLASRLLGEEGRVLLRVLVDTSGLARSVSLHRSSGHARLDGSALEAVWSWKFHPAKRGGKPVEAWVVVPIRFSLEGV